MPYSRRPKGTRRHERKVAPILRYLAADRRDYDGKMVELLKPDPETNKPDSLTAAMDHARTVASCAEHISRAALIKLAIVADQHAWRSGEQLPSQQRQNDSVMA